MLDNVPVIAVLVGDVGERGAYLVAYKEFVNVVRSQQAEEEAAKSIANETATASAAAAAAAAALKGKGKSSITRRTSSFTNAVLSAILGGEGDSYAPLITFLTFSAAAVSAYVLGTSRGREAFDFIVAPLLSRSSHGK
jgi:hypothetical protein